VSYLDEGEFERWMRSALRTLESARRDLDGGDYNWACFKSHQAAGKALKALLWGVFQLHVLDSCGHEGLPHQLQSRHERHPVPHGVSPQRSSHRPLLRYHASRLLKIKVLNPNTVGTPLERHPRECIGYRYPESTWIVVDYRGA
jgi:hypothetical protein